MTASEDVLHPVYLPVTESELRRHFLPVGHPEDAADQIDAHVRYYLESLARYSQAPVDREGRPISELRRACQIEKDERFWVAACLLGVFLRQDRTSVLAGLLSSFFGSEPPIPDLASWEAALDGDLHLYFETNLPSPRSYREWLAANLGRQAIVPYVRDAARDRQGRVRSNLEGPTNVDAILLNPEQGFAVLIEAKVLSDVSPGVTYDATRNQIARNVDVALEPNDGLAWPLTTRRPERTLFALLTPETFRVRWWTRFYGWLMRAYQQEPANLARDLPHRSPGEVESVSQRICWLTFEDFTRAAPECCAWLDEPGSVPGLGIP